MPLAEPPRIDLNRICGGSLRRTGAAWPSLIPLCIVYGLRLPRASLGTGWLARRSPSRPVPLRPRRVRQRHRRVAVTVPCCDGTQSPLAARHFGTRHVPRHVAGPGRVATRLKGRLLRRAWWLIGPRTRASGRAPLPAGGSMTRPTRMLVIPRSLGTATSVRPGGVGSHKTSCEHRTKAPASSVRLPIKLRPALAAAASGVLSGVSH